MIFWCLLKKYRINIVLAQGKCSDVTITAVKLLQMFLSYLWFNYFVSDILCFVKSKFEANKAINKSCIQLFLEIKKRPWYNAKLLFNITEQSNNHTITCLLVVYYSEACNFWHSHLTLAEHTDIIVTVAMQL